MNARPEFDDVCTTRISAKGQVVIPKVMRDRLGFKPGQRFDVVTTTSGILLLPLDPHKEGSTSEEVQARIDALAAKYPGPALSDDELNDATAQAWAESARRSLG